MFKPVGYSILVKPDEAGDTLKSETIAIPTTVSDKWRIAVDTGVLVDIGQTAWKGMQGSSKPWAKVGDRVVFQQYGGRKWQDPDTKEEYLILMDKDVLGVI